jgi:hypothetical protein
MVFLVLLAAAIFAVFIALPLWLLYRHTAQPPAPSTLGPPSTSPASAPAQPGPPYTPPASGDDNAVRFK